MVVSSKLIEFDAGLFGIQSPENLGFILDRITRKKVVFFSILTTKGIKEIKSSQITKRKFNFSVEIPNFMKNKEIEKELSPRLKDCIQRFSSGKQISIQSSKEPSSKFEDESTKILPPNEHDLWLRVNQYIKTHNLPLNTPFTIHEIAKIWFDVETVNNEQYTVIDDIVKNSLEKGVGYFDVVEYNPYKWAILSSVEYSSIIEEIRGLNRLREKLVEVEEFEDEEGLKQIRYIPVGIKYAGLTDVEQELFSRVQKWMAQFIQNNTLGNLSGLGNTKVHKIDKFSLGLYLRYLAEDWTGSKDILQYSSSMTEFLFKTDFWSESEALEAIAKRAVYSTENFTWDVDQEVEELAKNIPEPKDTPEVFKNRVDLTYLETYTIDPESARDFDQALSFEKLKDGYVLWVHIADVSYYVTRGSVLDEYAKKRATSVYLPSKALPMNPPSLSTGICALQADKPRLCITVRLEFNLQGERRKVDFYEAYILVKANLTYDYVDERLKLNDPYWNGMIELGNILRARFRGLDIETTEAKMSTHNPLLEVVLTQTSISSDMNEMFMIAANLAIGEKFRDSGVPGIYRCHPLPDREDVEKFNDQMKTLGLNVEVILPKELTTTISEDQTSFSQNEEDTNILDMLKSGGKLNIMGGMVISKKNEKKLTKTSISTEQTLEEDNNSDNKAKIRTEVKPLLRGLAIMPEKEQEEWMKPFRDVLEKIKGIEDPITRKVMHLTTLGMFGRAYYTKDNIGHFGLGLPFYSHFTAPIRRYSDIIAHRLLRGILHGVVSAEHPVYTAEELEELGEHCSTQSQKAESLEFQVIGAGLALMTRRQEWQGSQHGVVTKVLSHAAFILINDMVEGRLRMSELTKDEIIIDPAESIAFRKLREDVAIKQILHASDWQELLDEQGDALEILIKLGQKVKVEIISRDYVEGTVNVKLTS